MFQKGVINSFFQGRMISFHCTIVQMCNGNSVTLLIFQSTLLCTCIILISNWLPCSQHQKLKSPILEFKALQNAFKIKKQGWKYFSKVIDKNYYTYTIKRGFLKALWLLCSILNSRIGEFDFWRLVHVIWHRMTNLV